MPAPANPRGQQCEQSDADSQRQGRDCCRRDWVEHGKRHQAGHAQVFEQAGDDVAERFGARVDANPHAGLNDMRGERRPAAEHGSCDCRGRVNLRVLGNNDADRAADYWPHGGMDDVPYRIQHRDLAYHELADVQHCRSCQNRWALKQRRYRGDVPEPSQQAEHEHRCVAVDTAGHATGEDQGNREHPRSSSIPRSRACY